MKTQTQTSAKTQTQTSAPVVVKTQKAKPAAKAPKIGLVEKPKFYEDDDGMLWAC